MTSRYAKVKSFDYSCQVQIEASPPKDIFTGPEGSLPPGPMGPEPGMPPEPPMPPIPFEMPPDIRFLVTFEGTTDVSDPKSPKEIVFFKAKSLNPTEEETSLGLELRTSGETAYIKVKEIHSQLFAYLSKLKNSWIKIDPKDFMPKDASKQFEDTQKKQDQIFNKIEETVQQGKLLKITRVLPSEIISGTDTYHYEFEIEKKGIKKLLMETSKVILDKQLPKEELADLDKALEFIKTPKGQIWIGKKDLLPYKAVMVLGTKKNSKSDVNGKMTITLTHKNYNKPVKIDIPAKTISLKQAMGSVMGGAFPMTGAVNMGPTPFGLFGPPPPGSFEGTGPPPPEFLDQIGPPPPGFQMGTPPSGAEFDPEHAHEEEISTEDLKEF